MTDNTDSIFGTPDNSYRSSREDSLEFGRHGSVQSEVMLNEASASSLRPQSEGQRSNEGLNKGSSNTAKTTVEGDPKEQTALSALALESNSGHEHSEKALKTSSKESLSAETDIKAYAIPSQPTLEHGSGSNSLLANCTNFPCDVVHTKIIEEDNPFVEHQLNKETPRGGILETSKMVNPNKQYKDRMNEEDKHESVLQPSSTSNIGHNFTSASNSSSESIHEGLLPLPVENRKGGRGRVQILEATKVSEGQGRSYITYSIKYRDKVVKRRYSEFESLRKILIKLFPMTLIPPIPEKQSLTSYGKSIAGSKSNYILPSDAAGCVDLTISVINGSVNNNDQKLIRHRIRMLTSFLNRLLQNEEITRTAIISDFLDPNNANWNDLINSSAAISSLPKNVLNCNPLDPTNATRAHAFLPIPSSSSSQLLTGKETVAASIKPTDDDLEFFRVESEYRRYEHVLHAGIYKYCRRITKNMHELKLDLKELSEAFGEFAIEQRKGGELAELLTYMSNVHDEATATLDSLVGRFYYNINEPLSEAVHMAGAARELIQYRRLKFVQRDILKKTLLYKEGQLKKLQEQEEETRRFDNLIAGDLVNSRKINFQKPASSHTNTYKDKIFYKFNKLAHIVKETVNYQDIDSKGNVSSVQKEVDQLRESLSVSQSDLKVITSTIRDIQLPAFSRDRDEELFDILKNYSKYMKEFATRNLIIWKELRKQEEIL